MQVMKNMVSENSNTSVDASEFFAALADTSVDPCVRGGRVAYTFCRHFVEVDPTTHANMRSALDTFLACSDDLLLLGFISQLRHFVQYVLPFEPCTQRREFGSFFGPFLRSVTTTRDDEDLVYEALEALGWLGDREALDLISRLLDDCEFRTYYGTVAASALARIFSLARKEFGFHDRHLNQTIDDIARDVGRTVLPGGKQRLRDTDLSVILSFSASDEALDGLNALSRTRPDLAEQGLEQWRFMVEVASGVDGAVTAS
jgi:hypothetical protein